LPNTIFDTEEGRKRQFALDHPIGPNIFLLTMEGFRTPSRVRWWQTYNGKSPL